MATDNKLYPVPVYKQNHGFIRAEDGATAGATVGVNVYNEDGSVFVPGGGTIADIDGLQAALDAKVDDTQVGAANGVAPLDAGGKISTSYLPSLAITEVFTVNSQAAMLALVADEGDVAIRTDLSPVRAYILMQSPASTLANWQDITGAYTDWSQITNKPTTFTPSAHTHPISDVTNLQITLNGKADIGGTPRFSALNIGADGDVYLYEGSADTLNVRTGPSTGYRYFAFNSNGDFGVLSGHISASGNIVAGVDVYAKDLRTDRGDGSGAVWFGGDAAGYMYRSGTTSFEFRAGANFYYLTSPGTVFTTGNFDPASKLNTNNPSATGDLTVAGRVITNLGHFNSTAAAAVLSAAGGTVYLRPNGADSSTGEATLTTGGNFTAPGYIFAGGDIRGAALYPTNNNGAYISGNGSGFQFNGNWYHNGPFFRLTADSAAWAAQPRTFVQSTDPGAQAADGDIWIW